jgi:OFA family oxalate/formate antiporter-like MFS transporter
MTGVVATKPPSSARHWTVASGSFIVMMGASIVLSGLLLMTAPIISDLYYQKDAAGKVVLRTLSNGTKAPVEVHGGQGAFLIYFSILTLAIVIPLMFFAGRLLARYGSRVMLIVGGIIMTGGLALFAASTGNMTFYLAGALLGLGYGMSIPLVPPVLVNAWFVDRRGLVLGIVLAGTGVGGLIWATIGPSLAQSSLGWRGVISIMAAAMAICTIVPALFLIRNKPADVGLVAYGADTTEVAANGVPGSTQAVPGFTYKQAVKNANFWIACASFLILGSVASLTQVLSIVFRTAAYPNPIDKTSWTPGQVAFYSSLFMVWLTFLVIWKPVLGQLNDKIGLVGMMLLSMTLMALALVYLPSMVYGSSVALMYVAMVFLSAGISNALVTPPLVITQAMGLREFGKIFALAVAFIYVGNAIGAPIWGVLGTSGNTKIGMYVAPVLLALFVIGCTIAVRRAKAQYTKLPETQPPHPDQPSSGQPLAGRQSA